MGCCTGRCFLITICVLQLISTIERLVFDFLGYMWAPIIGGFLQIIFVIIGLFGVIQYRPKILIIYTIWSLLWVAWNTFIICLYLEVEILRRDSVILHFGSGNKSWWREHGLGCEPVNTSTNTAEAADPVPGCFLQYYYVEVIQAGVQILLSLISFPVSCFIIYVFSEEDDSFDFIGGFDSFSTYQPPSKTSHIQLQPVYVSAGPR